MRWVISVGAALLAIVSGGSARADDTIRRPGDHPDYKVEIEPQLALGWTDWYGAGGYGAGARFTIPIVDKGFVPSINDTVAIGFGADFLHYDACHYFNGGVGYGCGANYLFLPVVMQWNFYVAQRWSVFAEPGLFLFHGFFDTSYCDPRFAGCGYPASTGVDFAFFVGGRYHFSDTMALTMRLGYPTVTVGLSFL